MGGRSTRAALVVLFGRFQGYLIAHGARHPLTLPTQCSTAHQAGAQHSLTAHGARQAMPLFNGSLVDGLLNELAEQWQAVPEVAEPCNLSDIRFHLDVLVSERKGCASRLDEGETCGAGNSDEEADAVADAIKASGCELAVQACSDNMLEVLLECNPAWRFVGGAWVVQVEASRSEAAGREARTQVLRDIKAQATAPASSERTLAFLVQLLRDSAYAKLPVHHKVYQLEQLLILELHILEGKSVLRGEIVFLREKKGPGESGRPVAWSDTLSAREGESTSLCYLMYFRSVQTDQRIETEAKAQSRKASGDRSKWNPPFCTSRHPVICSRLVLETLTFRQVQFSRMLRMCDMGGPYA